VYYNVYYHSNVDPMNAPQCGWATYKGQYSKPGFRPLPEVEVVSNDCDMRKDSRVCLCCDWHDMHIPHWHKASPVDLAVKRIVVGGAFQLLQQVRQGDQMPHVKAYMSVDIAGTDLYALLTSVEVLFIRCGLQGDWRKGCAKRKLREFFGMFVEDGSLKAEELEFLSSQSVFKYASSLPLDADPLQLFDFLELLTRVGSRAFPTEEPRSAFDLVLTALESSPPLHTHPEAAALQLEACVEVSAPSEHSSSTEEEESGDLWSLLQD